MVGSRECVGTGRWPDPVVPAAGRLHGMRRYRPLAGTRTNRSRPTVGSTEVFGSIRVHPRCVGTGRCPDPVVPAAGRLHGMRRYRPLAGTHTNGSRPTVGSTDVFACIRVRPRCVGTGCCPDPVVPAAGRLHGMRRYRPLAGMRSNGSRPTVGSTDVFACIRVRPRCVGTGRCPDPVVPAAGRLHGMRRHRPLAGTLAAHSRPTIDTPTPGPTKKGHAVRGLLIVQARAALTPPPCPTPAARSATTPTCCPGWSA